MYLLKKSREEKKNKHDVGRTLKVVKYPLKARKKKLFLLVLYIKEAFSLKFKSSLVESMNIHDKI